MGRPFSSLYGSSFGFKSALGSHLYNSHKMDLPFSSIQELRNLRVPFCMPFTAATAVRRRANSDDTKPRQVNGQPPGTQRS